MKRKLIILSTVITMVLTTACGNDGNSKKPTTTSANATNVSDEDGRKVDIIEYLSDINANTELGEKIVIEAQENTNEKKVLYNRITIALAENWIHSSTDLKLDRYRYNDQNDKASFVEFGCNCNYVAPDITCTEAEFTEDLKENLDLRNGRANMPTRISEVQIGKYNGYEYYKEAPSDDSTFSKTYHMWIDGYHIEFYISAYTSVDPTIYEEAYNSAMQAIASIEKIQ